MPNLSRHRPVHRRANTAQNNYTRDSSFRGPLVSNSTGAVNCVQEQFPILTWHSLQSEESQASCDVRPDHHNCICDLTDFTQIAARGTVTAPKACPALSWIQLVQQHSPFQLRSIPVSSVRLVEALRILADKTASLASISCT